MRNKCRLDAQQLQARRARTAGSARLRGASRIGTRDNGVPESKLAPQRRKESGMVEDRRLAVLRAIVEDYVSTEEPVGSRALVERHQDRKSTRLNSSH